MANRYFVQNIEGEHAVITGSDAAHLARVLRVKPQDTLCLCDGAGQDYKVCVEQVSSESVSCRVLERFENCSEAILQAEVYVAYTKGDKLDWVVQKTVELGAVAIFPFLAERCVSRPKSDKQDRFQRIAKEAAKQSGRGIIPPVSEILSFKEMLARALQNERAFFFHPEKAESLAPALNQAKKIALITGPESGFSEKEVQLAKESACQIVGLGPRILRCETAPVAALAAVMALSGEW